MTNQTNYDTKKAVNDFVTHLGNGKLAARDLNGMFHHVNAHRNTGVIVNALKRTIKKGDTQAKGVTVALVGAIFPGSKLKMDSKTGEITLGLKGVKTDTKALDRFDSAIKRGLSLRDTLRKEVCTDPDLPATVYTDEQIVEGVTKDFTAWLSREMDKYGIDEKRLKAILSAS